MDKLGEITCARWIRTSLLFAHAKSSDTVLITRYRNSSFSSALFLFDATCQHTLEMLFLQQLFPRTKVPFKSCSLILDHHHLPRACKREEKPLNKKPAVVSEIIVLYTRTQVALLDHSKSGSSDLKTSIFSQAGKKLGACSHFYKEE